MNKVRQADFGTPLPKSTDTVRIEIDGLPATVKAGTSILRAARESGVDIPKLCATDSLKPFGSCRMCLVEVEGRKGYPASCTTPVEAGMKIRTQTESLATLRRNVMELYISDHPLDCLTCSANGDCELQDVAGSVGLREVRYGFDGENHLEAEIDTSNPYFQFDASKCIVCSRCVRACDEVQGTFALTIQGRGFESKVSAGIGESFLDSECVSCGACVQACPTATLMEKSIVDHGQPDHSVKTTCAYCGVGCSFVAEMKGDQVVRMTPDNSGGANHGHSCVKGRFAWGYSTHRDRILNPLIRDSIDEPWRQVGWDEAIQFAAKRFKDIQQEFGRKSIGGITSSRCTNEEVFAVQKLVRAAMGNNNVDTCARVCHSPTGYGLKQTLGTSAGTQPFDSVMDADVIVVIGANPTEGHPVFASQMKRRLRQGARLIVVDPRRIGLVKSPHIRADYHLPLLPGTNVPIINAFAHVVVSEGLVDENYVAERCDMESFEAWKAMILRPENSPEEVEKISGVPAEDIRAAARLYGSAEHGAIYYGLGVTEHSQGSTMVMGMANLAMATGNIGFSGGGVNPLRGQNNVQGSCDMGSFPHELAGYRPVQDDEVRGSFENHWGVTLDPEPGFRIPNMFDEACAGRYKGMYIQGEDLAQSDPNTLHVEQALRSMECIVVQDLFLNETAKFAHVFLPGTSFLEKDGTFINAERRINRVRPVMKPRQGKDEWLITQELAQAMGYPMRYNSAAEIMDEIAELTPTFHNVSFEFLDRVGSVQWPCNEDAPMGTPIMHIDNFVRGKGLFVETEFVPTEERTNRKFPLLLTTGRVLSQYNVGAQTRRTANMVWYDEDLLEIHPSDAELRGIRDGDLVSLTSRKGEIALRATITERVQPGVVYTTFHNPETGANVVTTEYSDWATNCPEYKVTAVQVAPASHRSNWQHEFDENARRQGKILETT
ncbi:formate dehydrogenase subunit alpha [Gammaproteobacteria bacterium]|jgi:formate dehydrogenase major subunit|nr:formate dehydrogenase subunit alpha [Gammaproteobacteria bacterium]